MGWDVPVVPVDVVNDWELFEEFQTVLLTVYKILWTPIYINGYRVDFLSVFMFTAVGKVLWDIVEWVISDD